MPDTVLPLIIYVLTLKGVQNNGRIQGIIFIYEKTISENSDEPEERDQSSVSICFFQYMESPVTSKIKLEVLKLDHRRTMVRLGNPSWKISEPNC
jgi:hypothetical protein